MIRVDESTVELDPAELVLSHEFEGQLDIGKSPVGAVVWLRYIADGAASEDFWLYLADGYDTRGAMTPCPTCRALAGHPCRYFVGARAGTERLNMHTGRLPRRR